MAIPKRLHQIWIGSPMPQEAKTFAERVKGLHSGWEYKLWGEKAAAGLIKKTEKLFPGVDLRRVHPALASGLIRLYILWAFGGIYIDCDAELFDPAEKWAPIEKDFFMAKCEKPMWGPGVTNALMGSVPKGETITYLIEKIGDRVQAMRDIPPIFRFEIFAVNVVLSGRPVEIIPPMGEGSYAIHHGFCSFRGETFKMEGE